MKLEHHLSKLAERHGKTLAAATAPVSQSQIPNFTGTWVNELGSTVGLVQSSSSVLSPPPINPQVTGTAQLLRGIYFSPASNQFQQAWGPLTGYVSSNLISFAVTWFNFAATSLISNAAWEGYATAFDNVDNPTFFKTSWQVTYIDEKGKFVVETGNDEFKKTS